MSTELQVSELKPASFVNGIQRDYQTESIRKMIIECIEKDERITIDKIVLCWLKQPRRRHYVGGIGVNEKGVKSWMYFTTPVDILKYARETAERRARIWFMNNLGAAIIKGKLLVIPVIDIEQKQIQSI